MDDGKPQWIPHEVDFLHGAQEVALRVALEEVRHLAAHSELLALNAAFESVGASRETDPSGEMAALGRSAAQTVSDADSIVKTMEQLLLQLQSTATFSEPL